MNATDMRKLAMRVSVNKAEKWWNDYKQDLFKEIEKTAKFGDFRLMIGTRHKLNKDNQVTDNALIRATIEQELEKLGYHTELYIDSSDRCFIISWN